MLYRKGQEGLADKTISISFSTQCNSAISMPNGRSYSTPNPPPLPHTIAQSYSKQLPHHVPR